MSFKVENNSLIGQRVFIYFLNADAFHENCLYTSSKARDKDYLFIAQRLMWFEQ